MAPLIRIPASGTSLRQPVPLQFLVISGAHFQDRQQFAPYPAPLVLDVARKARSFRSLPWNRSFGAASNGPKCMCISPSSDFQNNEEENFWELPEGKRKLGEIEDMKELIMEANKLKEGKQENDEAAEQARKLSEEIAQKAKEQAERRKQAEQMFNLGQRAYERGMYDRAVEFLEAALTKIPGGSQLGGEVQVWLAMAYEANGRHKECIALYKSLESSHPNRFIRRQAKDLRYILEAPRLKISKEEMVSIPLIGDNNSETRTWSKMYKERRKKPLNQTPPTKDYLEDWLVWKPPRWERSPYFWVAVTVWLTLVGISLMFQD